MKNQLGRVWGLVLFFGIGAFSAFGQEPGFVPGKMHVKLYNQVTVALPGIEGGQLSNKEIPEVFFGF